jgi:hypothetical protein
MTHTSHEPWSADTGGARRNGAGPAEAGSPPQRRRAGEFSPGAIVTICIALHLLASTLIYRDMARDLYGLFDAAPRLLVLERGLVRLTAVSVYLPPIIPTTLVVGIALWLGMARRANGVTRWLALAVVPLAIDSLLRAVGVLIAPAPSAIGDLLELPTRFSIGPRVVLDLAGVRPSPGIAYWVVVCTAAAAVSAWCVSRAVLAADAREHEPARHRRARGATTIDAMRAGVIVAGTWIALAFAGQVALPWATQLFLRVFG